MPLLTIIQGGTPSLIYFRNLSKLKQCVPISTRNPNQFLINVFFIDHGDDF